MENKNTDNRENKMEWFKKHADTVMILGGILSTMIWMNGRFNEIDGRFSNMEKEMAIMKTVLIMKEIMPVEMASNAVVK